jgi:hypothetical protein
MEGLRTADRKTVSGVGCAARGERYAEKGLRPAQGSGHRAQSAGCGAKRGCLVLSDLSGKFVDNQNIQRP